jgi:hypothetical protein
MTDDQFDHLMAHADVARRADENIRQFQKMLAGRYLSDLGVRYAEDMVRVQRQVRNENLTRMHALLQTEL